MWYWSTSDCLIWLAFGRQAELWCTLYCSQAVLYLLAKMLASRKPGFMSKRKGKFGCQLAFYITSSDYIWTFHVYQYSTTSYAAA
jgi:hypothetical protein